MNLNDKMQFQLSIERDMLKSKKYIFITKKILYYDIPFCLKNCDYYTFIIIMIIQ